MSESSVLLQLQWLLPRPGTLLQPQETPDQSYPSQVDRFRLSPCPGLPDSYVTFLLLTLTETFHWLPVRTSSVLPLLHWGMTAHPGFTVLARQWARNQSSQSSNGPGIREEIQGSVQAHRKTSIMHCTQHTMPPKQQAWSEMQSCCAPKDS